MIVDGRVQRHQQLGTGPGHRQQRTATVTVTYNSLPNNASRPARSTGCNDNGSSTTTKWHLRRQVTLTGSTPGHGRQSDNHDRHWRGLLVHEPGGRDVFHRANAASQLSSNAKDNLGSLGAQNGTASANNLSSSPWSGRCGHQLQLRHLLSSSIAGFVYADSNNDGVFQATETG